jgi:hypothetical protein
MNLLIISIVTFFVILLILWSVYNFYWLSQPQLYNVVMTTTSAYDVTTAAAIAAATGGKMATIPQLNQSLTDGAGNCTFGYALCDGCSGLICANCTDDVGVFNIRNVQGLTGTSSNCSITAADNNSIGSNGAGQAYGYWMYGSKPASSSITVNGKVWTVQPWVNNGSEPTDGRTIFNKFQIFGIPKFF